MGDGLPDPYGEPHEQRFPSRPGRLRAGTHLRQLAKLWLPAAILVGIAALGAARTTALGLVSLLSEPDGAVAASATSVVIGGLAAVVLGRITWRLAVEVPRTLRGWDAALEERRAVEGR